MSTYSLHCTVPAHYPYYPQIQLIGPTPRNCGLNMKENALAILGCIKMPFKKVIELCSAVDVNEFKVNGWAFFADHFGQYFGSIPAHHSWMDQSNKKLYHSIRFRQREFFKNSILKEANGTFLDIGCTNGEKLAFARLMGYEKCLGIEMNEKAVKGARLALKGMGNMRVFHGDAFNMGQVIKQADTVYTYCPIIANTKEGIKLMTSLLIHILENLKIGARHLEVFPCYGFNFAAFRASNSYNGEGRCITRKDENTYHCNASGETFTLSELKEFNK